MRFPLCPRPPARCGLQVCRQHGIERWPFRKRSSLDRLVRKTEQFFAGDPQLCAEALATLEAERVSLRVSVPCFCARRRG